MREIFDHRTVEVGTKKPYHVTLCILKDNEAIVAEGVSICSNSDQYNRKIGNRMARGRAHKALREQRSYNPIRSSLWEALFLPFRFKGMYFPFNGGQSG